MEYLTTIDTLPDLVLTKTETASSAFSEAFSVTTPLISPYQVIPQLGPVYSTKTNLNNNIKINGEREVMNETFIPSLMLNQQIHYNSNNKSIKKKNPFKSNPISRDEIISSNFTNNSNSVNNDSNKKWVIVMMGLPTTGKSTISNQFSNYLNKKDIKTSISNNLKDLLNNFKTISNQMVGILDTSSISSYTERQELINKIQDYNDLNIVLFNVKCTSSSLYGYNLLNKAINDLDNDDEDFEIVKDEKIQNLILNAEHVKNQTDIITKNEILKLRNENISYIIFKNLGEQVQLTNNTTIENNLIWKIITDFSYNYNRIEFEERSLYLSGLYKMIVERPLSLNDVKKLFI